MNKESKIRTASNVAMISGIFMVIVGVVMLFNYLQLANNDPVESEAMQALIERLSEDQKNEQLREEIRTFDLMARKAYFTSKWQIATGTWLLIFSAAIFVMASRIFIALRSKIDEPEQKSVPQQMERILASRWILGLSFLIVGSAIAGSLLSKNHLDNYQAPPPQVASAEEEEIEFVDLTAQDGELETAVPTPEVIEESPEVTADDEPADGAKTEQVEEPAVVSKPGGNYPGLEELKSQFNGFRGPLGNGVAFAEKAPTSWNGPDGSNVLWKVKIPVKGFSSPVIWDNKLYVTGANNQERWVYCYNKSTGDMLWQHKADNITGSPAQAPKTTDDTGLAAPSVVTNGKQVVAVFGTGDIVGLNTSGERLWARNLGVPDNHYGHSSSLQLWNEKVVVQYDSNKGGRLLTIHCETGEIIWDVERTNNISWASPILIDVEGKMQIVTSSEPKVAGHDLETGKELWSVECMMGEVGPSPAYGNGLVIATNEYATLAAIDPVKGEMVWEDNYYLPEVASPVISEGIIFIATTYGVFAAFDVHTGNMLWEAEFDEGFYASPIVAAGHVYATDMNGVVHVMKVAAELEIVANNEMGEDVMTTPAIDDGKIFIRGNEFLYCIGE